MPRMPSGLHAAGLVPRPRHAAPESLYQCHACSVSASAAVRHCSRYKKRTPCNPVSHADRKESRRPECHADSQPRQRSQSRRVKEHTEDQSKGTRKDTTSRSLVGAGSSERSSYDAGTLYELCANFVANGRKVLCCELGCELCCELCANSVVDWRKINLNRYL